MTTNATITIYKANYITTTNKIQLLGKGNNKERKIAGKGVSHHHHLAEPNTLKSFEHCLPNRALFIHGLKSDTSVILQGLSTMIIKTHDSVSCGPRSWCATPWVY